MEIALVSEPGDEVVMVRLSGKVVSPSMEPGPTEPLAAAVGADCYAKRVVVDMEETSFIDSSGIGWILETHKRFEASGGRLVLFNFSPLVMQLFELLKLGSALHLAPNEAQARQKASD